MSDQMYMQAPNGSEQPTNQTHKEWHNVPAGEYEAWVNAITAGATKSGKPRITIVWRIINGPERGNRIYDNITVTEIGEQILRKKFTAIMPTYHRIERLTYEEEASDLVMPFAEGKRYKISVSYNDKGFVKVYIAGIIDK